MALAKNRGVERAFAHSIYMRLFERRRSNAENAMMATKMNGSSCMIAAAPGEAVTLPFLAAEPVVELATVVMSADPKTIISNASKICPRESCTLLNTPWNLGMETPEFESIASYCSRVAFHLYLATKRLLLRSLKSAWYSARIVATTAYLTKDIRAVFSDSIGEEVHSSYINVTLERSKTWTGEFSMSNRQLILFFLE